MKIQKAIIFSVVVFLLFTTISNNKTEAATDLGNYIKIKLDIGDGEIFEGKSTAGVSGTFEVTSTFFAPGATTYECAIFLTEEDDLACDDEYVTWVLNQNVIGRGASLNTDTVLGRINCCGGGDPACDKHWAFTDICGDRCDWTEGGGSGAGDVFSQNYGVFWTDLCAGADCNLLAGPVGGGRTYSFPNEILCETTWKRCDDPLATCYTYNSREYACTGAGGGMTWDNCTAAGKTCVGGACVLVSGLSLTASANPTAIAVGNTSTITFKVTNGAGNVNGATVNGISVSAGVGTVSAASCVTNAAGECTVTYDNGVAGPTTATITSTKATKAGETDSGSANAIVTVAAADWMCAPGPDYADACPGPVTDVGTCVSLNGAGPGCAGVWQNCGAFGCDAGCNGVCGTCVTKYQACKCSCGAAATCNNDGVANNGETGVDCGGGGCGACAAVCAPNGCGGGCPANCDGYDDPDCGGNCLDHTCASDAECCTNNPGLCAATEVCDPSTGACVECLIHDDCAGTDVCSNNVCIPCTGEGNTPASFDISLCCAGLDLWDKDNTGTPVCTSACNPSIGFYCNTLRGSVDNIVQGGEQMIGYILGIIGSVALLLIIIAGIMYMTAAGVEEKITSAKRILSGAVIGLGIALLAFSLLQVIMTVLNM